MLTARKFDPGPKPIVDKLHKIKIDAEGKPSVLIKFPEYNYYQVGDSLNTPEVFVCLEDSMPGEKPRWFYTKTEVQYILAGKAGITYWLSTSYVKQKMTVEEGDCYVIPAGAVLEFNVEPPVPLRKFCVVVPGHPPMSPSFHSLIEELE